MTIRIRNEEIKDYRIVEELTRKAFWNLHVPGCDEHYLVHVLRDYKDFIPELDLVLEVDGQIIANIMYTRSKLIDEHGKEKEILTFGPLSVLPQYQRKGYGKKLLEYSFKKAVELGFDGIVIFGNPENYISSGFKSCIKYNISIGNNTFPMALLVKELVVGALSGGSWSFYESEAYSIDGSKVDDFDKDFELLEKEYNRTQELFYIYSHSTISE